MKVIVVICSLWMMVYSAKLPPEQPLEETYMFDCILSSTCLSIDGGLRVHQDLQYITNAYTMKEDLQTILISRTYYFFLLILFFSPLFSSFVVFVLAFCIFCSVYF